MPDDSSSQVNEVEEVVVVVPEDTAGTGVVSGTGTSGGDTTSTPDSG